MEEEKNAAREEVKEKAHTREVEELIAGDIKLEKATDEKKKDEPIRKRKTR